MDRIETYIGQSILEWNFSKPDQNKMVALGKVISAMFGSTTVANGLACTPQPVASMAVNIAPGEIYQLAQLEATACGTLPADTAHSIMKQGIALDTVIVPNASTGVTALTAPSTSGQSINYLIQAAYADSDVSLDPTTNASPVILPFYNSSNPSSPYQGPNGSGTTSNTFRKGIVSLLIKAGAAATTGSQLTPTPDSGYVGLWVISVAYGQTSVGTANIAAYTGAPMLPSSLMAAIQAGNLQYGTDVSSTANVVQGLFPLPPAALVDNQPFWVKIKNANTGATTFTPNPGLISDAPVVGAAHAALQGGECVANGRALLIWRADISSFVLESCSGGAQQVVAASQALHAPQAGQVVSGALGIANAGGTANAITASFPVSPTALVAGQPFTIIASAANTGAVAAVLTLGGVMQSSLPVVKGANQVLAAGDIPAAGYPGEYNYSAAYGALVMENPATGIASGIPIGSIIDSAAPAAPSGFLVCPTVQTNLSRATYPNLFTALTIQTTASWTSGSTSLTVALATNMVVGYPISGLGIASGAIITAISGNTVTISVATTAAGASTVIVIAPWGVGDGSTTFGMPWFPIDYASVQASSNLGTQSVGQVISHSHPYGSLPPFTRTGELAGSGSTGFMVGSNGFSTYTSSATGGAANLAAGVRVLKCVKYQ